MASGQTSGRKAGEFGKVLKRVSAQYWKRETSSRYFLHMVDPDPSSSSSSKEKGERKTNTKDEEEKEKEKAKEEKERTKQGKETVVVEPRPELKALVVGIYRHLRPEAGETYSTYLSSIPFDPSSHPLISLLFSLPLDHPPPSFPPSSSPLSPPPSSTKDIELPVLPIESFHRPSQSSPLLLLDLVRSSSLSIPIM